MSRRNKKKHEHVNHERWLVSYADFITLLFAFFVVLYSSAQVDKRKMVQVAAAIQGGFQQMGVFSVPSGPNVQVKAAAAPNPAPPSLPSTRVVNDLAAPVLHPKGDVPLSQIKSQLENALSEELANHQVEMRLAPDGLVVSLREVGFFNSGEAQPLPGAEKVLTHVAQVLGEAGYQIRVEGHTDDIPINNGHYHSNWELSTARATQVVLMMVKKCGFQPEHISVAGYAQYHPVAVNSTEEGRRRNRRIDLVVIAASPSAEPANENAQIPQ
jgi:chemotaxis protein MotB